MCVGYIQQKQPRPGHGSQAAESQSTGQALVIVVIIGQISSKIPKKMWKNMEKHGKTSDSECWNVKFHEISRIWMFYTVFFSPELKRILDG